SRGLQLAAQIGGRFQSDTAVGGFGQSAAVPVDVHRAAVAALVAVFPVVADVQSQAIGDKAFVHQLVDQAVRHFLNNQPRFFLIVGAGQHLALADAVRLGAVGVDLLHAAGLDAPGVVDQNLRVHPELPV